MVLLVAHLGSSIGLETRHTHLMCLGRRMEDLLLRLLLLLMSSGSRINVVARDSLALGKGCSVHILEQLVFLNELVLQHRKLSVDLAVLVLEAVDLNLCVHVLLIKIFAGLECHLWHLSA